MTVEIILVVPRVMRIIMLMVSAAVVIAGEAEEQES